MSGENARISDEDILKWQKRLEDTFSVGGVVGGFLVPVIDAERDYGVCVTATFRGYNVMMDCFYAFYIETLLLAGARLPRSGETARIKWYAPLLLGHAMNFRRFRAAENLLRCGYPLAGYALLRDLKDQALFLGAIADGVTSWNAIGGFERPPGEGLQEKEMRRRRKREESRVLKAVVGGKSGLNPDDVRELARWGAMFHSEVHGSRLSFVVEGGPWLRGESPLPVLPTPNRDAIAMYFNRSGEIAWLVHRTLPFLQLSQSTFGEAWSKKWYVLDDALRFSVRGLAELGKKVASSLARFVDVKFPFRPETTWYREEELQ